MFIKTSEELKKLVNGEKDLIFPKENIKITFEPTKEELRNVICRNLDLAYRSEGLNFNGNDFIGNSLSVKNFNGNNFIGREFYGKNFNGNNFYGDTFNGNKFNGANLYEIKRGKEGPFEGRFF